MMHEYEGIVSMKKFKKNLPEGICCCLQTCNLIRCHGDDVVHMYSGFHL